MCKALIGLGALTLLVACSGGSKSVAGPDRYCALVRSYSSAVPPDASPQMTRKVYEDAARDIRAALAVAPAAIRPDVATVADGLDRLMTVLEKVDYDGNRVGDVQGIDTPEFEAAGSRVDDYTRRVCG